MKTLITGAILSAGFVLAQSLPAHAQVTFSAGRSANSPSVTFGQPYYPGGAGSYYGQPGVYGNGYYTQPGTYRAPNNYVNNPAQPYPSNGYYNSGYRGFTTAPGYAPNTYYAPSPYGGAGSGYYGGQGMYLNIPRVGSVPVR